jgi:hypothetical protein
MKVLIAFLLTGAAFAQVTFTPNGSIDCAAQGCQVNVNGGGDTPINGAWLPTGTFTLNGVSRSGSVLGSLNDGQVSPCATSGDFQLVRLTGIDFTTPSNGSRTKVNCMTDYGTGADMTWPPDAPGTCALGGANNCTWATHGITSVNGKLYWQLYRQQQGTSWARDVTMIVSSDGGATWCNKASIGGSCSATGDVPTSPGGATYTTGMLFKDSAPWDGGSQKMGFISFVHYCQDESISCPAKDNNATYTYMLAQEGNYGATRLVRWPKTSMPTLNISTMEYYVCATWPTTVCDGTDNANWTATQASATALPLNPPGAMMELIYLKDQDVYVGTTWNGNNGDFYMYDAPHPWGPFTLDLTTHPRGPATFGVSVFTNMPLAAVTSNSSTSADVIVLSSTSSVAWSGGSLFMDRFTVTVPASATDGSRTSLAGKAKIMGSAKIGRTASGGGGGGGITSLTVVGSSNTQAMVSYVAPDTNPCTLEVSESNTYAPVVNDVNTTLFASSNSDNRDGDLTSGTSRIVVLGQRVAGLAADTKFYSRALQTNTTHYLRVTCGVSTATTSFATANIPGGATYQDIPKANGTTATWQVPTTTSDDRTQVVIDQFTGAYMRAVTARSDRQNSSAYGFNMAFGGFVRACTAGLQTTTDVPAKTGYVCQMYHSGPEGTSIYFIQPSTGLVRKLGFLGPSTSGGHVQMDHNMCFTAGDGTEGHPQYRYCYTGDWQEHSSASLDGGTLYSSVSASTQLAAFDATFDPVLFGCAEPLVALPNEYQQFSCSRLPTTTGAQDTYGWIGIYSGGDGRVYDPACTPAGATCPGVVAAFNPMNNVRTRFCGNHNFQVTPNVPTNPTVPELSINWHGLANNSERGTSAWGSTLTADVNSTQLTITVAGQPLSTWPFGDTFSVGNYQVGDKINLVTMGSIEDVQVAGVSGTGPVTLTLVDRHAGFDHVAGDSALMACNALNNTGHGSGGWMLTYWNFLQDIHGTDTTNTNLVEDEYFDSGGHYDAGLNGRLSEGWPTIPGIINLNLNIPIPLNITDTPSFHGRAVPCFSSTCVKHPSYHQTTDTPSGIERQWFTDQAIFNGGDLFFGGSSNPSTLVTGTLYKYGGPTDIVYTPMYTGGLWRKLFPTMAITGARPYLDISSPATGNVIGGTSADNWKYCVALKANECRTGSSVNDIFFNTGVALDFLYCTPGDAPNPTRKDICISPSPAYANAIPQLLTSATNSTNATRRSRVVAHGVQGPRLMIAFPSAKQLPDASWSLFYAASPRTTPPDPCDNTVATDFCNVWIVKNPPFPALDGVDRSDFNPATVNVTVAGGLGITNVIVRFGYLEWGDTTQLYCTSRAETCVAHTATVTAAPDINPFAYPVEGTGGVESGITGVACTTSCTVDIPTISGKVVYYRVVYRNSSNATVSTGSLTAAIVP